MLRKIHLLPLFTVLVIVLYACANIGTPDGGPYDETPPRVVHTTPKFGATHSKATKIVLEFDENVRLERAAEKVVISPPQMNQPEIDAVGKRITVSLEDSLLPNTTYTIDFSDAISDNNEGNPLGDYAFTFSTGAVVDTFQVSGYVLDASNLEPIKGILVGLYAMPTDSVIADGDSVATPAELPDSVFRTRGFERVSRTDSRGHFVIKGIAPGRYRAFALQDQDQNFMYSQKSEMLAFSHRILVPSARPDIREDTIWHDSIHYDSIVSIPYTHFFPDDIALLAFQSGDRDRAFLKSERPQLEKFSFYFTAPDSALPHIEGLNFDATDAFFIDANPTRDTLTYWIRDSLIYNQDTLHMALRFHATDTLGQLVEKFDTLTLTSKISYERVQKRLKEAWENYAKDYRKTYRNEHKEEFKGMKSKEIDELIEVPPMPETFLEAKYSSQTLNPDHNFDITFKEPIDTVLIDHFHFAEIIDSVSYERDFLVRRIAGNPMAYRLYAEWQPGSTYELLVDTGAVVSIYGRRLEGGKKTLRVKDLDAFSTLFVTLQNADTTAVVQLLNGSDKVIKTQRPSNGRADFYFVDPGTYYLRLFNDTNGDGVWSTGDYDQQRQAEAVYYYPGALELRAQWEISQTWNPTATPVYEQKPLKITKQKPDREKKQVNKNAQRKSKKR